MLGPSVGCAAIAIALAAASLAAETAPAPGDPAMATILRAEFARQADPETLATLLGHPDQAVRARALLTAARLRSPRAAPELIRLLEDPAPAVRRMAAFALGTTADSSAVKPLIGATGDSSVQVAAEAALALGRFGGRAAGDHLVKLLTPAGDPPGAAVSPLQTASAQALARIGDSTRAAAVVAVLTAGRPPVVAASLLETLEKMPRQVPAGALIPHLAVPSPLVRARAARALAKQPAEAASVSALTRALADPEWRVRAQAARALGEMRAADARDDLAARLRDASPHVREMAAVALGQLGPGAGTDIEDALVAATTDTAAGARRAAVTALGAVLGERSKSTLATRMDDPSPFVAAAAVAAYGTAVGPAGLEVIAGRADAGQPALVRMSAIGALAETKDARSVPLLTAMTADGDWVVAAAAAGALAELDARSAEPALIKAASQPASFDAVEARVAALEALGRVGSQKSEATLATALADSDPRVRDAARSATDSLAAHGVALASATKKALAAAAKRDRRLPLGDSPAEFPLAAPPAVHKARIVTPRGVIELQLFPEVAPMAVSSFVALAESGFYQGGVFHRVVPDFVIQGGCPRHDGYGGPPYALPAEVSPEPYTTGALGMADAGLDTGGSQFFITHSPQHRLDGRYTLFGRVTAGMAVVDQILQNDSFRIEVGGD